MSDVLNQRSVVPSSRNYILDDHALYARHNDERIPVSSLHKQLADQRMIDAKLRIETVENAYEQRRLKYAEHVLSGLMEHKPYRYSQIQNRAAMHELAHPIQKRLALMQYNGQPSDELRKDIEAIYGNGAAQLEFLLSERYQIGSHSPRLRGELEGSLSELTVFLLAARQLTGDDTDPYLITPSRIAEDVAPLDNEGRRQGFDFSVLRTRDNVTIPLQVKTTDIQTSNAYTDNILVVSTAELVKGQNVSPQALSEALYFEISNADTYNAQLINVASSRLTRAFDAYQPVRQDTI